MSQAHVWYAERLLTVPSFLNLTCYWFYMMALMIYDDLMGFIIHACSSPGVFEVTAKQDTYDVTHLRHSRKEIAQNQISYLFAIHLRQSF